VIDAAEPNHELSDHLMRIRKKMITDILAIRQIDADYARDALRKHHANMPWMDLMNGVRAALKGNQ